MKGLVNACFLAPHTIQSFKIHSINNYKPYV